MRTSTIYSLTSSRPLLKSLQCIPPLPHYLKLPSLLSAILCFIFLYHTHHGQRNYNRSVVSDPLWPMDCSLPGSSTHGISQARILSGLPCPPPRCLPHPGMELGLLHLLHWQVNSLPLALPGKHKCKTHMCYFKTLIWG